MATKIEQIEAIRILFHNGAVAPVEDLREKLSPITIGGVGKIAVAAKETRMFRVRRMDDLPMNIADVREPPVGVAPIGRLNEAGQTILYLSDSPRTAFAESMISEGICCLSEWRVECDKLGLINGGMPQELMHRYFPNDLSKGDVPKPTKEDEHILELFREIFTVDVGDKVERYAWSIACGSANGFSHVSDKESEEKIGEVTKITGRTPFSALVYPSIRMDKTSVNYALNDQGRAHVSLHQLQWVRRHSDGRMQGIDFADSWDNDGNIEWQGRPANFQLKPGEGGKVTKIAEAEFLYETNDGSIPWFT